MNMRKACKMFNLVAMSLVLAVLSCAGALAQDDPPIKISLTAAKTSFESTDPIKLQIRVYNAAGSDVITREGFFDQNFYTLITFTDPDGLPVRNIYKQETNEPGPTDSFGGRPAAEVEIIPPVAPPLPGDTLVGERILILENAREYYKIDKYGWYTAEILVPMETFSYYEADERGVTYGFLDDPGRKAYNPVASNKVRFEILSPTPVTTSAVQVKVSKLTIGLDARPRTIKSALGNIPVKLIPQSDIPADYYPINWKTYGEIWAWTLGGSSAAARIVTRYTDWKGIAKFEGIPQGEYLALAFYDDSNDFNYMGSPIPAGDPGWTTPPIQINLMVIEKDNGKKIPGKTRKLKGSELVITEPEFVVWGSTAEKYPFVFESVGDWSVSTAVAPPQGFVTDYKELSAQVANEMETVQFTITDKGAQWKETDVTYKIKHKGKTQTIKSKIGIKLTKELAKKKGLGVYGHTPVPGPFKGGKKVN